jgi:trk system potassium uptake protein
MKVIIVGAGRVGLQLGKMLTAENNDVTIIDPDSKACRKASDLLDAMVIQGNGAVPSILEEAGIKSSDMLIAVTSLDEINILACLAASRCNVGIKIARLRNTDFSQPDSILKKEDMGIDLIIHPELETARELVWLIKRTAATDIIEFENGQVQLIGVRIDKDQPIINKTLRQIDEENPDIRFRVVAIFRTNKTIIPGGDDYVQKGDQLFFMIEADRVPRLLQILGKGEEKMENIMILGGGKVGRLVASDLEKDKQFQVKLIEAQHEKGVKIAEQLKRTLIIMGDGTDIDLLAAEGIMDMDGYIAVTDDEESNIISCLVAKHLGVKRCLAMVQRSDYLPIMSSIGLDAAVDQQMITANAILRFVRRGNIVSLATLPGIDAEVLQIEVHEKSKASGKELNRLKMPKNAMIGILSRNGDVSVPIGTTILKPGDKLFVFTLPNAISEVEKMFAVKS